MDLSEKSSIPLVSIIIPVYNVEKYLEECINSVLNQTYKNIEIILVDDGSTDSSGSLCDKFKEQNSNVQVIHQKNAGLSDARTAGLKFATGKYVYFLDSDDYISAEALEKLCMIAENDSADIVFFDAHSFLDESDEEVKQNYKRKNVYNTKSGIEIFSEMQKNGEFHSSVPLMYMRREFLSENNISFISSIYYEDMVFTFEALCLADKVSQCSESLYFRRYRKDSIMTSKKSKKYFDSRIKVYKIICDFSKRNKILEDDYVKKYIARNAFNVFNDYYCMNYADKKLCKNDFQIIKKDIIKNNAFDDTALKFKCYNNVLWIFYKGIKKIFG